MAGRTMSLTLSCPHDLHCRMGQYVLLQCLDVSLIEWHPFTVVKVILFFHTSLSDYFDGEDIFSNQIETCVGKVN